jgi:hypothetical protein
MDMRAILDRIDAIASARNLSDRKLSLMAGMSGDVIRNWRRRVREEGDLVGASRRSIAAVARVLQVSPEWLLTGSDESTGKEAVRTLPETAPTEARVVTRHRASWVSRGKGKTGQFALHLGLGNSAEEHTLEVDGQDIEPLFMLLGCSNRTVLEPDGKTLTFSNSKV